MQKPNRTLLSFNIKSMAQVAVEFRFCMNLVAKGATDLATMRSMRIRGYILSQFCQVLITAMAFEALLHGNSFFW